MAEDTSLVLAGGAGRRHGFHFSRLALAIAYHAVNLHNGAIRALNRPDGGLTVEIRLPM